MGIAERKLLEKEKRKKSILKSARKVFKKVGFENTSMDLIAEEAQLSKGTLYLYFKSKDDLFINSLLEDQLITLDNLFKQSEQKMSSVVDIILAYTDSYYDFTEKFPDFFNLLVGINSSESLNIENLSLETREKIQELEKRIFLERVRVFQRGIEEGIFEEKFSACYAVTQLWVSITGAIHLSKKPQLNVMFENINTREFVKDITKLFLISFSRSEELKKVFLKDIWNNAIAQAPSAIHKYISLDKSFDENSKSLICNSQM
jgi:AcrR family transcriptional regulator